MTGVRALLRDRAAGVLWAAGATRPARTQRGKLAIATFHRCLPDALRRSYPLPGLVVTPEELDWFLGFFGRHYQMGTLAESLAAWRPERRGRPLLALTFDDAQRDNTTHARPVLERHGARASFFVPVDAVETGQALWHDRLAFAVLRAQERRLPELLEWMSEIGCPVGLSGEGFALAARAAVRASKVLPPEARAAWLERLERALGGPARPEWDGMMSWADLAALAQAGHEIGSHSLSHALLTQVGDAQLEREVRESREVLEKRLGVPIESFCYPNGSWDPRAAEAVERAGYRQAVSTEFGTNAPGAPRFSLRRYDCVAEHARSRAGALSEPRQALRMSALIAGGR